MTAQMKFTDKRLEGLRAEMEARSKDLEAKSRELEETRNRMLRLQADFDNAQKRRLKEQAEFQEQANRDLLRELLEIYDDLERALAACPAGGGAGAGEFQAGVEMIRRRFGDFLKSYGVVPMEAAGQLFDPARHEAVAHEQDDSVAESTVLEELRKGYLINGKVLRHAVVKVAVKSGGST